MDRSIRSIRQEAAPISLKKEKKVENEDKSYLKTVSDPHFLAVDDVVIPVGFCGSLDLGNIRASVDLRE